MTFNSSFASPGLHHALWQDPRILLVEDDPADRELFTRQIQAHIPSASLQIARRLDEAFELVETTDFDAIILDLNLPDSAGYQTLHRARGVFDTLPVIVLTGVGDEEVAATAVRYGAKDFLTKGRCDGATLALSIRHAVERFRASEALRASEDRYRTLFETSRDAICIADRDGILRDVNEAMFKLFRGDWRALTGQSITALCVAPEDGECLLRVLAECGGVSDHEIALRSLDGRHMECLITATTRYGRRGEVLGFQATVRDMTQQRRLQTELAQAQKMESVGQLAAGIAHEINTPTQFVLDNLRFLADAFAQMRPVLEWCHAIQRASGPDAVTLGAPTDRAPVPTDASFLLNEVPSALNESVEGLHRISRVVTAMREFANPGSGEHALVDVRKCIENTLVVSRNEWKYQADIEAEYDPEAPLVLGRSDELNQVFLALIANAVQAIADRGNSGKGVIRIRTRRSDPWLEIAVTDNGVGIPEAFRHRIFDPFFTTRRVGQGVGQGLSVARAVIVNKHHGELVVDSQLGIGSTFTVRLPLHATATDRRLEERETVAAATPRAGAADEA